MRFALRLGCCLLAVLGAVVSYIKVSALWLPYDGFSRHLLLSELPLLAALVGLWVPVGTARGWLGLAWSGATALCLIGALYVGHDVFYVALNRLPGVADLSNIRVLGEFGGWPLVAVTTVLLLATGTWTGLLIVEAVASQRSARYLGCMGLRLLLGMALLWSLPWYAMQVFQDYAWSELRSIETNGRLVAFVHRAVVQTDNVQRLRAEAGRIQTIPSPFVAGRLSAAAPRTIHLVVLESFGDPRRIGWLRYEPAPLAPELTAILGGDIAHWTAVSPVFGGGTAQAEFELLSGAPALQRFHGYEFNVMRGYAIGGWVAALKRSGYQAVGTIGTSDYYFNSAQAYHSLGLEALEFHGKGSALRDAALKLVHDEDLLARAMERIRQCRSRSTPPAGILSYVLGFEGHLPYNRNTARYPDRISVRLADGCKGTVPEWSRAIANQFHHRTRVLAQFIQQALRDDPHCLLVIAADHLPSAFQGETDDLYGNLCLVIVDGKPVDIRGYRYHQVAALIWRYCQDGSLGRELAYASEGWYERLMFEAMGFGQGR
jgi:hypothetical protein